MRKTPTKHGTSKATVITPANAGLGREEVAASIRRLRPRYGKMLRKLADWEPPAPHRLGWKGLTDAQIKEQAQVSTAEISFSGSRKK